MTTKTKTKTIVDHVPKVSLDIPCERKQNRKALTKTTPATITVRGAAVLKHMMEVSHFNSVNMNSPTAVTKRFNDYLELCVSNQVKPNIISAALAFNLDRMSLLNIANGKSTLCTETTNIIKKIYVFMNAYTEETMLNGDINVVAGIFVLKNNFNYSDKSEITVKHDDDDLVEDAKSIRDKYLNDQNIIDAESNKVETCVKQVAKKKKRKTKKKTVKKKTIKKD